jgi:uncharacterized membrane protein
MAEEDFIKTNRAPVQTGAFFDGETPEGPPLYRLVLKPHRSLSRAGFALVLLIAWGFSVMPLLVLLGTSALWALLPFLLGTLVLLWFFIELNYRDAAMCEELSLWPDVIRVDRFNPRKASQHWQANPYWVRLKIYPEGGPVENYLTLKGAGRVIELGAFLSPEEREDIYHDLNRRLGRLGGLRG